MPAELDRPQRTTVAADSPPAVRTFSSGGGVQSIAALVLSAQGRINFPVHLFANVGDDSEAPATLRYVREIAMPYAAANGIEFYEIWRTRRDGTQETILQRIHRSERSLPIPVRMSDTGAPGKRTCTADFKISVISAWQKRHGATSDRPAVAGLGISVDEIHRARTDSGIPHQRLEYPLLELGLRRSDCTRIIADAGLPVPPKSACWFCPYHRLSEWQRQKRDEPETFARSCALERLLIDRRRKLGRDPVYLTRYGAPLPLVTPDQGVLALDTPAELDACESGYCMT